MSLRTATPDDIAAIARIRRQLFPYHVESIEAYQRTYALTPPRAQIRIIVAEEAGEIIGYARGLLNYSTTQAGAGILTVAVLPPHRGRGLGTALLAEAETHLRAIGADVSRVWGHDNENTARFAAKHGYEQSREMRFSMLDPRQLPPMPEISADVRLADMDEVGIDAVYAFDCVAALDEPGDVPHDNMPKDEWISRYWENPDEKHDLGVAALIDGVVAAATFVEADMSTGRSWSGFTGTLPEYRGRGLAKLVKSESLRRVAAAGITEAYTSNDEQNGPMLAVNTWLGYQIVGEERSYAKKLG